MHHSSSRLFGTGAGWIAISDDCGSIKAVAPEADNEVTVDVKSSKTVVCAATTSSMELVDSGNSVDDMSDAELSRDADAFSAAVRTDSDTATAAPTTEALALAAPIATSFATRVVDPPHPRRSSRPDAPNHHPTPPATRSRTLRLIMNPTTKRNTTKASAIRSRSYQSAFSRVLTRLDEAARRDVYESYKLDVERRVLVDSSVCERLTPLEMDPPTRTYPASGRRVHYAPAQSASTSSSDATHQSLHWSCSAARHPCPLIPARFNSLTPYWYSP